MENDVTLDQIYSDAPTQELKTSKLAVASLVFGILGPFSAGAMWLVSLIDFLVIPNTMLTALFSCGLTWILGLVLGIKSLKQIENEKEQLLGKEYAIAGIVVSATWMVLILASLLLPALFYVNS